MAGPSNGTTFTTSLAHRTFALSERRINQVGTAEVGRNADSRVGCHLKDSRLCALSDGTLRATKICFDEKRRCNKHLETFHAHLSKAGFKFQAPAPQKQALACICNPLTRRSRQGPGISQSSTRCYDQAKGKGQNHSCTSDLDPFGKNLPNKQRSPTSLRAALASLRAGIKKSDALRIFALSKENNIQFGSGSGSGSAEVGRNDAVSRVGCQLKGSRICALSDGTLRATTKHALRKDAIKILRTRF